MISALTTGPLAQAVGWALLHLLWQGAIVAGLLWLALAWLPARRANLRYLVSCAALAVLVALAVATGIRSYPAGGDASAAVTSSALSPRTLLPAALVTAPVVGERLAGVRVDRVRELVRVANESLPLVVTLWVAGVVLLSLRLVVQWLRAGRLARDGAVPARDPWPAAARRLADALGVRRAVRVLESAALEAPAVLGLVRPVILLPASSLLGLTSAQLEMILAHELAHIRRHDFLVNLLQTVVETLLFYHPAVWWISRCIRAEREHCCDDLAIAVSGTPLLYARALTRLEELRAAALPLAVSATGGSLLDRIRRILNRTAPGVPALAGPAPVRGAAALGLLMALLLAVASPSLSARGRDSAGKKSRRESTWREKLKADEKKYEKALLHEGKAAYESDGTAPGAEIVGEDGAGVGEAQVPDAGEDALVAVASDRGRNRLSVDDLIALRVHNVTAETIMEMRFLFRDVTIQQIAGMNAVGATPHFVREMRAVGLDVETPGEAQGLAAVGVTPEYVGEMREAGFGVTSASEAQGLRAVGVTPRFVNEMLRVGLEVSSAAEIQGLAAVGVTPEYVLEMREAGIDVNTPSEAQSLRAVGVSPRFVRDMRRAGMDVTSAEEACGLAAVGVSAGFIRDIQASGLEVKHASEMQSLAAVGVTADWIHEMRAAGVELDQASDAQSLRALGVTPAFVRKLQKAGYTDLTVGDLSRLAAAGVSDSFIREMARYRKK
jgi:beta-lactamase regulating signal transducer with metallopeptidase domain